RLREVPRRVPQVDVLLIPSRLRDSPQFLETPHQRAMRLASSIFDLDLVAHPRHPPSARGPSIRNAPRPDAGWATYISHVWRLYRIFVDSRRTTEVTLPMVFSPPIRAVFGVGFPAWFRRVRGVRGARSELGQWNALAGIGGVPLRRGRHRCDGQHTRLE